MKSKKKLICLAAMVTMAITGGLTYANLTESTALETSEAVTVNGQVLTPQNYSGSTSVIKGLPALKYAKDNEHEPYPTGISKGVPTITLFENYSASIEVFDGSGKSVFKGNNKNYKNFRPAENGTFEFVVISYMPADAKFQGKTHLCFQSEILLQPKITSGSTTVTQGDVFRVSVTDLPSSIVPTASTSLGMVTFTENGTSSQAFVPVGYLQAPGTYTVSVSAGEVKQDFIVTVVPGTFIKQYMTINKCNPVISEASSPKAYQQYRDEIHPLYKTADKTLYWEGGKFTQPIHGRITTQFGLQRFTNGSSVPNGHGGVDIAAAGGTPVLAPAAGRVVYSKSLLNTGNTLVIEHGGGLKSYYYHMNALHVKVGDMVWQGQHVGDVGTTGYSTGNHLHFEVKIGDKPINPWNLINGTGGLFQ